VPFAVDEFVMWRRKIQVKNIKLYKKLISFSNLHRFAAIF